jgi:MFS family permease
LTLFGTFFVGARLLFANAIRTYGGSRVAVVSLSLECAGLLLLWLAHTPHAALAGAALTGFGFALVFPALGVEAVELVPPASRGAALAAYSVFFDLSLGVMGPLAGYVAGVFGYPSVFLVAAIAAAAAAVLSVSLYLRQAGTAQVALCCSFGVQASRRPGAPRRRDVFLKSRSRISIFKKTIKRF